MHLSHLLVFISVIAASHAFHHVHSRDARSWREHAVKKLWAERRQMGHTPLVKLNLKMAPTVDLHIKNETASASGTLKHRFVWALVMWAIVKGKITENSTVFDSTSGNTGASEAYMCRLIGVPYVAVVANNLEEAKVRQITQFGGQIVKVELVERNYWAARLASETAGGFFINQFGNADVAEEYHESGDHELESSNVFHEILSQLRAKESPPPDYFVHSAGTGGTISSVGKYIARYGLHTKVVLADSQFSLFHDYVLHGRYSNLSLGENGRHDWVKPGIPGIGYGYATEPILFGNTTSLLPSVIDQVVRVPDMATMAGMRSLRSLGVAAGPSTAINFLVALRKAIHHRNSAKSKHPLRIVLIMGDPGRFYESTNLNDTWVDMKMARFGGMAALECWREKIDVAINEGSDFMLNADSCSVSNVKYKINV